MSVISFSCQRTGKCCKGGIGLISIAEAMSLADQLPLFVSYDIGKKKDMRSRMTPKAYEAFGAIAFNFPLTIHGNNQSDNVGSVDLIGFGSLVSYLPPKEHCPALQGADCGLHGGAKPAICRVAPLYPVGAQYEMGDNPITANIKKRCPECFDHGREHELFRDGKVVNEEYARLIGDLRREVAEDQLWMSGYLTVAMHTTKAFDVDTFLAESKEHYFSAVHFMTFLSEQGRISRGDLRRFMSAQERVLRRLAEKEGFDSGYAETYGRILIQIKMLENHLDSLPVQGNS